jgi:hypothetical protein
MLSFAVISSAGYHTEKLNAIREISFSIHRFNYVDKYVDLPKVNVSNFSIYLYEYGSYLDGNNESLKRQRDITGYPYNLSSKQSKYDLMNLKHKVDTNDDYGKYAYSLYEANEYPKILKEIFSVNKIDVIFYIKHDDLRILPFLPDTVIYNIEDIGYHLKDRHLQDKSICASAIHYFSNNTNVFCPLRIVIDAASYVIEKEYNKKSKDYYTDEIWSFVSKFVDSSKTINCPKDIDNAIVSLDITVSKLREYQKILRDVKKKAFIVR